MNSRRPIAIPRLLPLAAAAWLLALAQPADLGAATITVGPGCSLANAILSANADADTGGCTHEGAYGDDLIVLPNGTYPFNAPHAGSVNALPPIASNVTIVGNGSTIQRPLGALDPFFRFFEVASGHLVLLDLTLTGGRETKQGEGGAIRAVDTASLTLASVQLTDNAVDQSSPFDFGGVARGGAVYFSSTGVLTLHDVALTNNTADASGASGGTAEGGAVYMSGPGLALLTDVTATGNRVLARSDTGSGGVARGGAVFVEVSEFVEDSAVHEGRASRGTEAALVPGSATVTRGTFAGNTASANSFAGNGGTAQGGGLYYESELPDTTLVIAESVFLDNTVVAIGNNPGNGGTAAGGGAHVKLAGAGLSVRDSTFKENLADASANTGNLGGVFEGAGLNVETNGAGTVSIVRSAFTNNTGFARGGKFDPNGPGPGGLPHGGVGEGGGLRFEGPEEANLTLVSVTAASNSGACDATPDTGANGGVCEGGGVWFGGGLLTLTNVTVTGNSVTATGVPGCCAEGGGFFIDSSATYQNSIFAANVPENCRKDDAPDVITSLGNNIIDNISGCAALAAGDKLQSPTALGALTDTGKPGGVVRLPGPGSNALDAGNAGACPAIDQLGLPRQGPCDVGAAELVDPVPQATLLAAVLPASRSGLAGVVLTAFVTIINTSATTTAHQVGIALDTAVTALLGYQTTDATNALVGLPDTPADIAAGAAQSFVIFLRPTGPFPSTDLTLDFKGTNTQAVTVIVGLNTFLASASVTAIPDVVALAATVTNDGIVNVVGGAGAFSVATINLGAGGPISVSADTGAAPLGLALFVCETDPATAVCKATPAPTVTVDIATNATPTFAVFVNGGPVVFDPAANRVFVFFRDAGSVIRGGTSVAVRTL